MLTGISRLLARLDPMAPLADWSSKWRVYGVPGAAKPALIAALSEIVPGPLLVVTAHPQTAHDLAQELPVWTEREVALFPATESLPYERVHLDRMLLSERESVSRSVWSGTAGMVVAPVRAVLQPVRGAQASDLPPVVIRQGNEVSPENLARAWIARGYTSADSVEEPGTFARRGGVLDIFPVGLSAPVRIDLFGNEVESTREFDPISQRSMRPVESVTIHALATLDTEARQAALTELLALDTSTLNAEAETAWLDDLARLEADAPLDDVALLAPYLMPGRCSIIDNLPAAATVLVDTANETWALMRELNQQAGEVLRGLEDAGSLPRGLMAALVSAEAIERSLTGRHVVEWFAGSPTSGSSEGIDELDWSGLFSPAHLYAGRMRALIHDLSDKPAERVVIASYQHERVAELLSEDGLAFQPVADLAEVPEPGIALLPVSAAEGWRLPAASLTLLTDHELFGRPRMRPAPRPQRAARDSFFARFEPGDYVVHLEHGIGRFDSITRMTVEGAEREYAVIHYAGADRVYVPTDQLERLTRYIGVGETPPPLSRLGGGEWQRARQRAKQAADDIARELVEIYSKRKARPAFAFSPDTLWQHELESSFPFPETPDQLKAIGEVKEDMEAPRPMDRLVCADVGYGKTEVAVRAAFKSIMDGKQVAVLVPTTILAQQHLETFGERLTAFPVRVEALSRFRSPAQQREILRRTATGEVDVVIGTHRLLQKDVSFKNLGLLIIDEEQRFGVRHKEQLKRMREAIDVLTLTATPIPRTLHMGLVGIREISVIDTPPEGRLPIKTYLQPFEDRLVREAVLRELDREGQVYIVHNRVATIQAMAEKIRTLVPESRVVVAHGQIDEAQLEKVMLSFAHQEADVLVCSTIIENGLDIPNVNTIILNNAHRLGLTQLYQLRGRVGRSFNQAYAYLLYPQDIRMTRDAARRMEAVFEAQELGAGMSIAMRDLEIRGVGNLLGAEQSGHAAAIGFDLYTRMIGEAVERLRGAPVEETPSVTLDLPVTMYLPPEYVGSETERLTLYRRLAAVGASDELDSLSDEIRDRFGSPPAPVQNLLRTVRLKLLAREARVTSVSLGADALVVRGAESAVYDRVSLYQKYATEARISTNVLRLSRHKVGLNWLPALEEILTDMIRLRQQVRETQTVGA
jgi:transcription-repair coupling factor (superfamily II helicase)